MIIDINMSLKFKKTNIINNRPNEGSGKLSDILISFTMTSSEDKQRH